MASTFVQRFLVLAALSIGAAAHAAPTTLSSGAVNIEYDTDGFSFSRDTTAFGGVSTEDVSVSLFGIEAVGHGVKIDFNGYLSVHASSYDDFSPKTLSGNFNALFNFTAAPGYAITGYTLTYSGDYHIETPGSASLGDSTGAFLSETTGGNGFNISTTLAGSLAPGIQGSFSATGDLTTLQVFDGYDTYLDHYEDVLDYCEDNAEPPVCYYRQEPVYISQPIYHDETDLGDASISIQSVILTANVVAVPEPSGLWLLLAGLPLAAWRLKRRPHARA